MHVLVQDKSSLKRWVNTNFVSLERENRSRSICICSRDRSSPKESLLDLFSVAVVIAFFICYAPLYFQRLLLALMTLTNLIKPDSSLLANFMAYIYVISGLTFYFGSAINPILYNILSNQYRRAFRNLCCCRCGIRRLSSKDKTRPVAMGTTRFSNPKQIYRVKQLCSPRFNVPFSTRTSSNCSMICDVL